MRRDMDTPGCPHDGESRVTAIRSRVAAVLRAVFDALSAMWSWWAWPAKDRWQWRFWFVMNLASVVLSLSLLPDRAPPTMLLNAVLVVLMWRVRPSRHGRWQSHDRWPHVEHRYGVPWMGMTAPPSRHWCRPWTRSGHPHREYIERCRCGATRIDSGDWTRKNRRREESR